MTNGSDEEQNGREAGAPGGDPAKAPPVPTWVKALGLVSLFLVTLFAIAMLVQPGQHGPGRHRPSNMETNHDSEAHLRTEVVGEPADPSEAARTIEITSLDSPAFQPGVIDVRAGEVVTFVVRNEGLAVHEFTLGDSASQQEHAEEMAKEGGEHSGSNSIQMQPGETKSLTWRFGKAGVLEYACHVPGHYESGMRGTITVR